MAHLIGYFNDKSCSFCRGGNGFPQNNSNKTAKHYQPKDALILLTAVFITFNIHQSIHHGIEFRIHQNDNTKRLPLLSRPMMWNAIVLFEQILKS